VAFSVCLDDGLQAALTSGDDFRDRLFAIHDEDGLRHSDQPM
jgi:hypothetical protein